MPRSFSINVDLSEVISEFNISGPQLEALSASIVDEVTQATYRQWVAEARKELKSTRQQYIRSLQVISEGRLKNTIVLKGKFANMLEFGIGSFDMKAGFAQSAKAKRNKKGGWYLTIPFRMATPGALGESEVFAEVLPSEVYKAMRGVQKSGRRVLKREDIPAAFSAVRNNPTTGYQHKSSIYEGLRKTTAEYQSATQGQYNTFRRVSSNSDPSSWIHRGLKEHAFAEKAMKNTQSSLDVIVENAIDKFLEG